MSEPKKLIEAGLVAIRRRSVAKPLDYPGGVEWAMNDIRLLLSHIDAMEAEYKAGMQRAIDDAFRQGEATQKFIDEQTARIAALQETIVSLRQEMRFDSDQENDRINQMWALVYPDDPTGWDYWDQVWRHVRDQRDELRQRIAVLEAEKANGRRG
jgi:hypothetical protein